MDDNQLTIVDYIALLRRRGWLLAGTFLVTLVIGVAVALLIPATYRSAGTILIESQQIPTDLVQATVTSYADERIEVIKQRVMTRENLLRIIRKYQLFADAGPTFTPSDQIDEMRKTIAVELVNAKARPERGGPATIAFQVSFEHRRPQTAQAVANDLVTLFLDENVKVRTQRASLTTEFMTQEADKLKKELDTIEAQIARYKQEHGTALPENVAIGVASMQRIEADLRQLERDQSAVEDELRAIEIQRAAGPPPEAPPAISELQRARAELVRLSASYTENHPDLKAARRRVESLEQAALADPAAAASAARRSGAAADLATARMDARAASLRERLKVISGQRGALRARLGQMDVALVQSPQVERGLAALTRDHQSAQRKYQEIIAKKMTAQVSESLEGGQKAERFAVLEPPTLPEKPLRPDRKKLLALSLIMSMAAPVGMVTVLESMQGTVRGVAQITGLLGQAPLVTIPVIPLALERAQRRKHAAIAAGAAVLIVAVLLALAHFFFLPLDVLLMKALIRLG
jgi:succinoglycan biosynthesis transport protein ExoP